MNRNIRRLPAHAHKQLTPLGYKVCTSCIFFHLHTSIFWYVFVIEWVFYSPIKFAIKRVIAKNSKINCFQLKHLDCLQHCCFSFLLPFEMWLTNYNTQFLKYFLNNFIRSFRKHQSMNSVSVIWYVNNDMLCRPFKPLKNARSLLCKGWGVQAAWSVGLPQSPIISDNANLIGPLSRLYGHLP